MTGQFHPLHRAYAAYGMQAPEMSGNDNDPFTQLSENPAEAMEQQLDIAGVAPEHADPKTRDAVATLFDKIEQLQSELNASRRQVRTLEAQADMDYTTQLPNRRAFFNRLDWSLSMLERYGHSFSLVCFDVMQYEMLNDRLGHHAADMAMRHAGQILDDARRETDFLARIGNNNFVLILHNADESAAAMRAERIGQSVSNSHFIYGGSRLSLSVSYGAYGVNEKDNADTALNKADLALRAFKEQASERKRTRLEV